AAALSGDCVYRAVARADGAAGAQFLVDFVPNQGFTTFRRAPFLVDVRLILFAEEAQRADNRRWGALAQPAQRSGADVLAQRFQALDVARLALAFANAGENFQDAARADAAGDALTAALVLGEIHEEAGDVDHAGVFVHHHQTAGSHH